jgi:hypothetical protein
MKEIPLNTPHPQYFLFESFEVFPSVFSISYSPTVLAGVPSSSKYYFCPPPPPPPASLRFRRYKHGTLVKIRSVSGPQINSAKANLKICGLSVESFLE